MNSIQLFENVPLSVSQANLRAKNLLERHMGLVTVVGEVSNFKMVAGHRYFTLKDPSSQLAAVLFARDAAQMKCAMQDGMEVAAVGRLTVYSPYGRYQLVCDRVEPRGQGGLQAAFEQLKAKLQAEGLFAQGRKRPLPWVPSKVAVVTSPTGAVIRDIINVATRRFPKAHIVVVPTRVQGAESAPSIVQAIGLAGAQAEVVIVARGGGSLEDLFGFNDERVARAIANCPVPVVSAVGHETDFTIADFVADCRAPTPSAAAELVFPRQDEILQRIDRLLAKIHIGVRRDVQKQRFRLRACHAALGDGKGIIRERTQRLAWIESHLGQAVRNRLVRRRQRLKQMEVRLSGLHPRLLLNTQRHAIAGRSTRLDLLMKKRVALWRGKLQSAGMRLQALSPLGVLGRGYAIVLNEDGQALRESAAAQVGSAVDIRLGQGRLLARVEEVICDGRQV